MAAIETGSIIAGKFRLDEKLAGGGMGSVWRGFHLGLDVPVAVKFMAPELVQFSRARARFEREAKAAARIRSPHVVHVYEHGIDGDVPYIVMELLEGEDLSARLRSVGTLSLEEADRICRQICKGLHRAHGLGIVHRDLKPANIFLSAPDEDMVKILDFGVARAAAIRTVDVEATGEGSFVGSPRYMSPEQLRGGQVDERSDLWALAVILYRALTGRPPFQSQDVGDLVVRISVDPIPPPSSVKSSLGPFVDEFFERALCRQPGGRYRSARYLAEAFHEAAMGRSPRSIADVDITARPSWDSAGLYRVEELRAAATGRSLLSTSDVGDDDTTASDSTRTTMKTRLVRPMPGAEASGAALRALPSHPAAPTDDARTQTEWTLRERRTRRMWTSLAVTAVLFVGLLLALLALPSSESTSATDERSASGPATALPVATGGAGPAGPSATTVAQGPEPDRAGAEPSATVPTASARAAAPRPRVPSRQVPSRPRVPTPRSAPTAQPSDSANPPLGY